MHQAGSNITPERLRFDFTHPAPVHPDELKQIENYVNEAIELGCVVTITEMDKEKAKADGVEGSFWERYPDKVKVYGFTAPDGTMFSKELC